MIKKNLLCIIFILFNFLYSTSLVVKPYLQDATPVSINILWETDSNSSSIVEWGIYVLLTETTVGLSYSNYGDSEIHTVELIDLLPNTKYFYRVIIGDYEDYSDLYYFVTPPNPASEENFRIVAMSDMQRDSGNSDKFNEIIHEGLLDYIADQYSEDIAEELAMVLVTGDLVDNGNSYSQWNSHFFEPAEDLLSYVPMYPVFGNHENDTDYFINYFHLPDNGTFGYEEHWYYTDYSNLRVIGLDSNSGYRIQAQLDWLDAVLLDACEDEYIDFVFTQLHHPHKSELWLPGEIDYTGDVIELMENFTENCGKPSIHFFGHTHGYSRGQSKNHEHLWVNVATAGGNIDYWGEYAQADYDEFTVTQDEWGFVLVDVEAGEDPRFTLKRISRGNENIYRDNEQRDEVVIRLNNNQPTQPYGISPNGLENPDEIILNASEFIDVDGDTSMAAQWEVYQDCDLFSIPTISEYINMENWYYNENTQESVELSTYNIFGLNENSSYCWIVRYRDSGLVWSNWSEPLFFETDESSFSDNLLMNFDAEQGTLAWNVNAGYIESLEAYVCDGIEPNSGSYYFIVGALCNSSNYAEAYQEIDVSDYSDCISEGSAYVDFGGYLSNWGGDDHPEMKLIFIDAEENQISESETMSTYNAYWTLFSNQISIPEQTNSIQVVLMGTRYAGDDNDSYFDDLFLRILEDQSCTQSLGDLNNDDYTNILDIILLVNIILEGSTFIDAADMNNDTMINILDVIVLVNIILEV